MKVPLDEGNPLGRLHICLWEEEYFYLSPKPHVKDHRGFRCIKCSYMMITVFVIMGKK